MANLPLRQAYAELRRGRSFSSEMLQSPLLADLPPRGDLAVLKAIVLKQPLNLLLVFSPLGILAGMWDWSSGARFWCNFVALIPLANLLGDATEELADALNNQTLGGLVNATFGNAVEMILTYQTVVQGLVTVAKGSLLGSILSNLLLVLGMAFFAGGIGRRGKEQTFKETGPMASISMLLVACLAFAVPTSTRLTAQGEEGDAEILALSRGTAIAVLVSYICYIFFQVYTHQAVFEDSAEQSSEGGKEGSLSVKTSCILLAATTVFTAWNSDVLVESIEPFVQATGISQGFIGVIILPIIGNACEHFAAIRMAMKDKPTLAIGIAVGSSAQIALFAFPLAVIFGWIVNVPVDLDLGILNVVVLTLAVLIVFSIIVDGKTNWLEGLMLIIVYLIVALAYYLK